MGFYTYVNLIVVLDKDLVVYINLIVVLNKDLIKILESSKLCGESTVSFTLYLSIKYSSFFAVCYVSDS